MPTVIVTVTYACEMWLRTASITNELDVFLRTIFRISWQDHTTNEEVMRRVGVRLLSDTVADGRRRRTGHVLQLPRYHPASGNGRVEEREGKEEVATYI